MNLKGLIAGSLMMAGVLLFPLSHAKLEGELCSDVQCSEMKKPKRKKLSFCIYHGMTRIHHGLWCTAHAVEAEADVNHEFSVLVRLISVGYHHKNQELFPHLEQQIMLGSRKL